MLQDGQYGLITTLHQREAERGPALIKVTTRISLPSIPDLIIRKWRKRRPDRSTSGTSRQAPGSAAAEIQRREGICGDSQESRRRCGFKDVWGALVKAGWTSKRPSSKCLDSRYKYIRPGEGTMAKRG
ncbi:hypothetical protein GQ600_20041 [Phytophthora cactorum]|nr:hypothetical protein GQ600_20041 [Phytophthora cactorum]